MVVGAAVDEVAELPHSVRALVDGAEEVFVVAPMLTSRLEWLASDVDAAHRAADERLGVVLEQLRSEEVAAAGAVGDDSPLTAVEDHVRAFGPDHVLIALRSREHRSWQERGLIEDIGQSTNLPITVFEVDAEGRVITR
ncbi:hypothetical protein [Capillimicrobium parvum]|uniref:hypothetical protein n=1 Tax=Capillimicrobium parvum TaxID=2884022 RepID=UPI00216AC4A9|nr:hypothetical protein [Capillimicrobium parvum]